MRRPDALALVAVTVLAAALRLPTLDVQSFWLDEAFTHKEAGLGLGGMLEEMTAGESNPPAYQVLAWLWAQPFGDGEVGLRSLSALIGTATVPVAWWALAPVLSRPARLVLAALVAVNPLLVWYSQEARSYALVVLLTVAALGFFVRALDERPGPPLAWWAVLSSLALATHYFAAFVVFPQAAWLAWRRGRAALAAVAAPLVTALAVLPLALEQRANGGASGIGDAPLLDRARDVAQQFLSGQYGGPVRGLGPLAALACAAGVALLVRRGIGRAAIPLAVGAGAVVAPFVLALAGFDYFTTRYVLIALVPLLAVVAAGLATRAALPAAAALAAVFAACAIAVPLSPRLQRDDWRDAAAALGDPDGPRAIVLSPGVGFVPLGAYEPRIASPPGPRFAVGEVAVVVMTREDRPRSLPPPVPGLRPAGGRDGANWSVRRFRSDRPLTVSGAQLRAAVYPGGPTGFVYEPPPPRRDRAAAPR